MRILIDTNIVLDVLLDRKEADVSQKALAKIVENEDEGYITAKSITDIWYVLFKSYREQFPNQTRHENSIRSQKTIKEILAHISILATSDDDIATAFALQWEDFEDAVVYATAEHNICDAILTNNIKDFSDKTVRIITPQQYI